jgi:hypothetical protein
LYDKFIRRFYLKDMPRAASASEVTQALDLHKMSDRQWFVQASCATSGEGIVEGLEWLAQKVKEKKKREGKIGFL